MFFSKKSRLIRKVKKELEVLSNTIDDLKDYQNLLAISREISDIMKEEPDMIKSIMDSKYPDDHSLISKAYNKSPKLLDSLRKLPDALSSDEWDTFKEHIKAEYNRVPLSEITNLALAGGGAKGKAYPGAARALAEHGIKLKSVSGTSAGALTALPMALGYSPRKIESIVYNYDFTSFIYESKLRRNPFLNKIIGLVSPKTEALMHRSVYLDTFKEHFEGPFFKYLIYSGKLEDIGLNVNRKLIEDYGYEAVEKRVKKIFSDSSIIDLEARRKLYKKIDEPLKELIKRSQKVARDAFKDSVKNFDPEIDDKLLKEMIDQEFKNEKDAIRSFIRMHRNEDVIEEFFGDLIENKLSTIGKKKLEAVEKGLSNPAKLRNISFETFQKIVDAYPESHLKSLAVCVCEKISDNPLKVLSKDNYRQIDVSAEHPDADMRNMPIKVAVRMSMNLPGAYSSYEYKGKKYVDGGVRANLPLHYFDKTLGDKREKTIGLCLAPEETIRRTSDVSKLGIPDEVNTSDEKNPLRAFFKKMKNNLNRGIAHFRGNKLDNNDPFDQTDLTRVGIINVKDVDTIEFGLSKKRKLELFTEGYKTANKLFSKNYNAQEEFYKQKIMVISADVTKSLENKEVFDVIMKNQPELIAKIREKTKEINEEPKKPYQVSGRVNKAFQ
jgi:predicted acylesterase/phospholipase RssA